MSSVLFAALVVVAFAATGAHGKCPASINPVTATVIEVFYGDRTPYDWTFSPTVLATAPDNCGPSYIAQHSYGKCDANCNQQRSAPVSLNDGCQYSFGDGDSRVFNLRLECDASASALTLHYEVHRSGYTYDFIGWYAGACEESTSPTEPTTTTTVVPTAAPPADSKATIMMLVIISVALSVVGVVLGAIAIVILMRKRSRPQGDASVTGYVLNTDGNINSALIVKQV